MILYHCSKTSGINFLMPRPSHLTDDQVVFATPKQLFALSMAHGSGKDFDIGYYSNKLKPNEKFFYMQERYRGAFNLLKKKASLYTVDPTNFNSREGLMEQELVSTEPVKVLKEVGVPNVLDAMRRGNAELLLHLKSAVIITGNPAYIKGNSLARRFYKEVESMLINEMNIPKVTFDPGREYTTPPKADLWIGHSRGMDRLRFAPKGTFTVGIGGKGGIYHPKDNQIEFDSTNPNEPNKYHYALTQGMKFQIKQKIVEDI